MDSAEENIVLFSIEEKLLSKINKNIISIAVIIVSIAGIIIRFSMRDILSGDSVAHLIPWCEDIAQNGLYRQVGDYTFTYQFILWIISKLPFSPIYAIKLLSCIFDYLLAAICGWIVYHISTENKKMKFALAYSFILLSPIVFLNSAAWAQCDAVFSAFAIFAVFCLDSKRYNWAMICFGLSLAFKLQAVFILPIFLFVYFKRKEFSIMRFLLVPLTLVVTSLPALFWGRNILCNFKIFYLQIDEYHKLFLNYPSIWTFLCDSNDSKQYQDLKYTAILLSVCIILLLFVYWIKRDFYPSGRNLIIMTFILIFSCVIVLPSMHERYGFLYEILAILIAVLIPKTIPMCIGLIAVSLHTYGFFLFNVQINIEALSFLNLALYVAYVLVLHRELEKSLCEKKL